MERDSLPYRSTLKIIRLCAEAFAKALVSPSEGRRSRRTPVEGVVKKKFRKRWLIRCDRLAGCDLDWEIWSLGRRMR
jgi:hypothetical protein